MLVTAFHWVSYNAHRVSLQGYGMVRVRVDVRVTTKEFVMVLVKDQKQIPRDCALASELVQAK